MTTGTENMVPRDGLLVAAEHEGAHGVCAASLGVPVVRRAVFENGGECIRGFTTPELVRDHQLRR
jgi:hypothetical protein